MEQTLMDRFEETFSKRDMGLMLNCLAYIGSDPAGLPGHNLMLIIYQLVNLNGLDWREIEQLRKKINA